MAKYYNHPTGASEVKKTDEPCPRCKEGKLVYYLWKG